MRFVKSTYVDTLAEGKNLFSKTEPTKTSFVNRKSDEVSWLKPKVRAARCSETDKKQVVFKQKKVVRYNENNKTVLFGKHVRIIKMWIPKGLTNRGPN